MKKLSILLLVMASLAINANAQLQNPYLSCEDSCTHVHGIDLSHYQGEVFWQTIGENTNMAYVYLKATEGGDNVDPRYERNIDLAHRHGLKVGTYHFFRPKTPLSLQLKNFKTQCLAAEQDLIPMLDVETTGGLSQQAFCDSLASFLQMLEQTYHQKPLVYTFRNFYNKHLKGLLDDYQLMVAMYADEPPVPDDRRDYTLWQYTSKGRIVGISGHVDKSRLMGRHTQRSGASRKEKRYFTRCKVPLLLCQSTALLKQKCRFFSGLFLLLLSRSLVHVALNVEANHLDDAIGADGD